MNEIEIRAPAGQYDDQGANALSSSPYMNDSGQRRLNRPPRTHRQASKDVRQDPADRKPLVNLPIRARNDGAPHLGVNLR